VGSIGVFSVHVDASRALDKAGLTVSLTSAGKYKTENSPYEPLSDEACQAMPKIVYATYEQFVDAWRMTVEFRRIWCGADSAKDASSPLFFIRCVPRIGFAHQDASNTNPRPWVPAVGVDAVCEWCGRG